MPNSDPLSVIENRVSTSTKDKHVRDPLNKREKSSSLASTSNVTSFKKTKELKGMSPMLA